MKETNDCFEHILKHEGEIEAITGSFEHLAVNFEKTNEKLSDILETINKQNTLYGRTDEKLSNIEKNTEKALVKIDERLNTKADNDSLEVTNNRLSNLEGSQQWVVRLIIGSLLTGLIGSLFILARG